MEDKNSEDFMLFVKNKYGLDLSSKPGFAKNHLYSDIIRTRAGSYDNYMQSVKNNKSAENQMLEKIVTNHTYFFRDDFHFTHTKNTLIPPILKRYPGSAVNIWCCAASTGQEAYSLAMTLDFAGIRFNITASDLSQPALSEAKRGIYPISAIDEIPPLYHSYCRLNGNGFFEISEKLKSSIRFMVINLAGNFSMKNRFDAVYCRNVLMYFPNDIKKSVIEKAANTIKSGGFLYIGANENISAFIPPSLEYISSSIYRKR